MQGNQGVSECTAQKCVGTHVYHITRLTAVAAAGKLVAGGGGVALFLVFL